MEIADLSAMNRDSELFATLYDELRRLADSQQKAAGRGLTLSATTGIHEAWLDLSSRPDLQFHARGGPATVETVGSSAQAARPTRQIESVTRQTRRGCMTASQPKSEKVPAL
jgi:hypothetical protein